MKCRSGLQSDLRSLDIRATLKLRPLTDVSKQKQPPRRHRTTRTADAAAADAMPSRGDEVLRSGHHSQHSGRPVRTPESEDHKQLLKHRRLRPLQPPATPQVKLRQIEPRSGSPECSKEAWESSPGSSEIQEVRRSAPYAQATDQLSAREMQFSALHLHRTSRHAYGHVAPGNRPGHSQLQPFWAALESGAQPGKPIASLLMPLCSDVSTVSIASDNLVTSLSGTLAVMVSGSLHCTCFQGGPRRMTLMRCRRCCRHWPRVVLARAARALQGMSGCCG